jgi:hypothetical protein
MTYNQPTNPKEGHVPIRDRDKDKASEEPTAEQPTTTDQPATSTATAEPPAQPDPEAQSAEDFRRQQRAVAQTQNLNDPNAVPEQRPQAFLEGPGDSDLTKRLKEEGVINNEPMPAEAYQKASSDDQREKAADNSMQEAVHVGSVIKVTEGPHRDRHVAVTRIESYHNTEDLVNVAAGRPEQRFAHPSRVEGSARGDERDGEVLILDWEDGDRWEIVRDFLNRRTR